MPIIQGVIALCVFRFMIGLERIERRRGKIKGRRQPSQIEAIGFRTELRVTFSSVLAIRMPLSICWPTELR
jgi:hypothetical protein